MYNGVLHLLSLRCLLMAKFREPVEIFLPDRVAHSFGPAAQYGNVCNLPRPANRYGNVIGLDCSTTLLIPDYSFPRAETQPAIAVRLTLTKLLALAVLVNSVREATDREIVAFALCYFAKKYFPLFAKYRDELVLRRSLFAARVITQAKSSRRPSPFSCASC